MTQKSVKVLSLDGGGVRGLSSVVMLEHLMNQANAEREGQGLERQEPWQMFDMIGGTSTGGLLAIMLGRLRMSVEQCKTAYINLSRSAFTEQNIVVRAKNKITVGPQFRTSSLETAIKDIIREKLGTDAGNTLLKDTNMSCRVFVVAHLRNIDEPEIMRSYQNLRKAKGLLDSLRIWEAARATSAAVTFFENIEISGRDYSDGGLMYNNPVQLAHTEAMNVFREHSITIISLGSGAASHSRFDPSLKHIAGSLAKIATETQRTADRFFEHDGGKMARDDLYFRFNAPEVGDISMEKSSELQNIEMKTEAYLNNPETGFKFERCSMKIATGAAVLVDSECSKPAINEHWMVPRIVNPLFTGRAELLERIQRVLLRSENVDDQKRFVITGLGGQGKSEICLKIASLVKKHFWGVFWIDVSNPSIAKTGFTNAAKAIGHSIEDVDGAVQAFGNTEKRWLLILDNADDRNFDYQIYLPSGTHGTVIMTSRLSECRETYSTVGSEELGSLDEDRSIQLVLKAAKFSPELWPSLENQAREVIKLLGSHTLALIQAGAYIANNKSRLVDYPKVFAEQRTRLLKYAPRQARSKYGNVYTTFEASADMMMHSEDETYKDALDLIDILSMLHFSFLHLQVFEEAWEYSTSYLLAENGGASTCDLSHQHVSLLPGFMGVDNRPWDSHRLTEAASLLRSLSLITYQDSGHMHGLSMHPLVHAWAKDRRNQEQQRRSWLMTGSILALSIELQGTRDLQALYLNAHLQAYLSVRSNFRKKLKTEQTAIVLPILVRCGWALLYARDDSMLEQLLQDVFEGLEINPQKYLVEYHSLFELRVNHLNVTMHFSETMNITQQIIEAHETPTKDDEVVLRAKLFLADSYREIGKFKKALRLFEHVVEVRKESLAKSHPHLLASQHMLAKAYLDDKQVQKAIELLKHVVEVEKESLAKSHPDLLASQHELTKAYLDDKQVQKALRLFEHVVEVRKESLAKSHPSLLASQHMLAIAYLDDKQVQKAMELFEYVAARRETLADDNTKRLSTQAWLAEAYLVNGQVQKAIKQLEYVAAQWAKTLAEDHPNRMWAVNRLADARELLREQEEAEYSGEPGEPGEPEEPEEEEEMGELEDSENPEEQRETRRGRKYNSRKLLRRLERLIPLRRR